MSILQNEQTNTKQAQKMAITFMIICQKHTLVARSHFTLIPFVKRMKKMRLLDVVHIKQQA